MDTLIHIFPCLPTYTYNFITISSILQKQISIFFLNPFPTIGPLSVEPYPEPDDDVDVDVDVVDCSDSESPSGRAIRAHHRHQLQQQHLPQAHHKLQRHMHHSQHSVNVNNDDSTGVQQQTRRSNSRGRASPQSPNSSTANDEDRLSPEPAQVKRKVSTTHS